MQELCKNGKKFFPALENGSPGRPQFSRKKARKYGKFHQIKNIKNSGKYCLTKIPESPILSEPNLAFLPTAERLKNVRIV